MAKTTIKSISEQKIKQNDNYTENMVSIIFETEHNGKVSTESITLIGPGSLKSAVLV